MFDAIKYILLSGVIISGFLSLLLLQKKNKSVAEIILLLWIFTSGYITFSYLLVYTGNYLKYPILTALGSCIPLLSGPFMYLYIKYQTKPIFFQKSDLLHFLPFILFNLIFIRFYFIPQELKAEVFRNNMVEFQTEGLLKLIATYISGLSYILWCLVSLYYYRKRLKKEFSNYDKINFNWFLMLAIGLLLIWVVVIFIQDDRIIFSSASIYVICIGFFGITQTKIFTVRDIIYLQKQENQNETSIEEAIKTDALSKESKLPNENFEEIYAKTIDILKRERLYLNPELKLLDLAVLLNLHPNLISKAINQVSEANFYDLVNKMRVDEFINKTKSEGAEKYTIIAMAFDSGFNSKATFYRNFKAITGASPSDFLKSSESQSLN